MISKFLDHGEVSLGLVDPDSRQLLLNIRVPYFILFQYLQVLSKAGVVGELKVMDPVTSWFPFKEKPELRQIQETIKSSLECFLILKSVLEKSGSEKLAFPILPTGIYVDVEYRCRIDELIPLLAQNGSVDSYMEEFRWAMTDILVHALKLMS